ncbi:substrate-binding domain-containing protein [Actinosynnema sp. CS-041913]|uniref:substrate-binding domain-containing protein n=1 Tax=Actinosynnema sp. CS-041913 TaxID=3239917 RepID=UPI003D8C890D
MLYIVGACGSDNNAPGGEDTAKGQEEFNSATMADRAELIGGYAVFRTDLRVPTERTFDYTVAVCGPDAHQKTSVCAAAGTPGPSTPGSPSASSSSQQPVSIGARIKAQLTSTMPGDITPASTEIQPVLVRGDVGTWSWSIKPHEPGDYILRIHLIALRADSDNPLTTEQIFTVRLKVEQTASNAVKDLGGGMRDFLASVGAVLTALGLSFAGGLLWIARRFDRRSGSSRETENNEDGEPVPAAGDEAGAPHDEPRPGRAETAGPVQAPSASRFSKSRTSPLVKSITIACAVVGFSGVALVALSLSGVFDPKPVLDQPVEEPPSITPWIRDLADCGGRPELEAAGPGGQTDVMRSFARAYSNRCPGHRLTHTASDGGRGVQRFLDGAGDLGGTDSALDKEKGEVDAASRRCGGNPAWHLPIVFDLLTIAYRLDATHDLTLTPEVIAKIFSGAIKTWDDPAITAANGGEALRAKPITVVHNSDQSRTTEELQRYLGIAAPSAWHAHGGPEFTSGTAWGFPHSRDAAAAIDAADGTIGYLEQPVAVEWKLQIAGVDSGTGPVWPTALSGVRAIKNVRAGEGNDLVLDLDALYASPETDAYPLILTTYGIVCSKGYDPDTARAVKAFLTVAVTHDPAALADTDHVPLPTQLRNRVLDAVNAIT